MATQGDERFKKTSVEILRDYETIIRRISKLCEEYDSGEFIDVGGMALQLRILTIDSSKQTGGKSLLNIMGISTRERILSTLPHEISSRTISSIGFLGIRSDENSIKWYAPLSDTPGMSHLVPSERWLDESIFKGNGATFTRRKAIRILANTQNGAHVAPHMDPDYYSYARDNKLGFTFRMDHGQDLEMGDPFPAVMRQICYEVLKTDIRFKNEGWLWKIANNNQG
jgi:hypothetical protein